MATVELWRAADDEILLAPASFAARAGDARAYLDNPGYGGGRLWSTSVEIASGEVLDLTGMSRGAALQALVDRSGLGHPGAIGAEEWVCMVPTVAAALVADGVRWVRVVDSYPRRARSTSRSPPGDEPEMTEVRS